MIDMKSNVFAALKANAALITLLGSGIRISKTQAPNTDVFPRITLFEISNEDSLYLDDAAYASEIGLQIDIWQMTENTFPIAAQVDLTMKSLRFKRIGSQDLFEEDTKVFHKALRYRTNIVI